jgi:hypothetical protein
MIQTKFGFNWSSSFRGEDFLKGFRRTTDGRQVMAIAHARWKVKILLKLYGKQYFHHLLEKHPTEYYQTWHIC